MQNSYFLANIYIKKQFANFLSRRDKNRISFSFDITIVLLFSISILVIFISDRIS